MTDGRAASAEPGRRQEVLDAALDLLAEQGYAGASLRKVAAKVGMAQPSLYHYFRTKEDLVEQVLATHAGRMFEAIGPDHVPRTLDEVPRAVVRAVISIYQRPSHVQFVRVAFAVSRINPRYAALMRTFFLEQAPVGIRLLVQPFVRAGQIGEDDAVDLVRMLINGVGLRLMEERVLFGTDHTGPDFDRFAAFVIEAGERLLAALRTDRKPAR